MKKDVILAGVGGQGILSISAIIGKAAVNSGLYLKQSEVHGMSQRGGDVHSNLRLSDKPVASDLIPYGKADMILSVEPMESLRYLQILSPEGWLITNTKTHVNIPNYPSLESLLDEIKKVPKHLALDADQMARDLGNHRAANMIILGAATPFLDMEYERLEEALTSLFKSKGSEIVKLNLAALGAGREYALAHS